MRFLLPVLICVATSAWGFGKDPFAPSVIVSPMSGGAKITVNFTVPAGHYLYADKISLVASSGAVVEKESSPESHRKTDSFSGQEEAVYDRDAVLVYRVKAAELKGSLTLEYQGCNDKLCFMPQEKVVPLALSSDIKDPPAASVTAQGESSGASGLNEKSAAVASGYLEKKELLDFIDSALAGKAREDRVAEAFYGGKGLIGILLVLLGGLALNLTPCVLPMIPVNLAIIGAGSKAGSRWRGLLLGGSYGLGIAVAYGVLGLFSVLTRARFGFLNSSPYFNFGVAAVFLVLTLAMFGLFNLDFTRFQSGVRTSSDRKGSFVLAFFLGGISALLAGACVAPVVISVLLIAGDMYQKGSQLGLILPFLLGLGMALPWPVAGAGLSFLPKPGLWMERVKIFFGLMLLMATGYYAYLGWTLWHDRSATHRAVVEEANMERIKDGWYTEMEPALARARAEKKPVFIDFWASWCKSCLAMERTTFQDTEVRARLDTMVKVKYRAENLRDPVVKEMLDRYGVAGGLPAYVVIPFSDKEM